MNGVVLTSFVSGGIVMGYLVAGLFFLRFWKETRDRLFGIFGAAFLLLMIQRILLTLTASDDDNLLLYGLRLLAFLLILWAIVDKNRSG